jgi:hypothetical protein
VIEEIHELDAFGCPMLYNLKIVKPKTPFWKRALLFCVGLAQVCVGLAIFLGSAGFGAQIGAWLMYEGCSDIFKSM